MTINDVNLRAVDLLSQLSQGHTPNLDAWDTTSTAKYPISLDSDNTPTNYYIKVEQVPFEVCNMIADMMPENVEILVDNDTQACSEGYNILDFAYKGFEGGGAGDGETPIGEQCGDTVCSTCQKCDDSTETCTTVADYEMTCTTDGKNGWCVRGSCALDTTCNCGDGQYCTHSNNIPLYPNPSDTCKDLNFREVDIDGTTYYISNDKMNWWDAMSACEALGKKMIAHSSITQTCNQADDIECSSTATKLNDLGVALYEKGWGSSGVSYIWSSILYDSLEAYDVELSDGSVRSTQIAWSKSLRAVCR